MSNVIEGALAVIGVYAAIGLVVGIAFVAFGAARVDPVVRSSGRSFRLLILPGCVGLWPLVAARWARAGRGSEDGS